MRREIIMFILFIAVTIFFVFKIVTDNQANDEYFRNLNLRLTGVVTKDPDCQNGYNGFCVVNMKILTTNIDNYDPRGKLDCYYAIIADKKAQIYQLGAHEIKKDDTVIINTKENFFYCERTNLKFSLALNTDQRFYNYVNKINSK